MKLIVLISSVIFLLSGCEKSHLFLQQTEGFAFEEVTELPGVLTESSGLESGEDGIFWSLNDRNGKAELYSFNKTGELKQKIKIINAENTDWEALAQDEEGNIFIGDFGNNENNREDLSIYKISPFNGGLPEIEMPATTIKFHYEDQHEFPPADNSLFFDAEALFALNDYLYILTKDRSNPFDGKTSLYRLPVSPGEHTAEKISEFITYTNKKNGQITAADISPDGRTLALLANRMLYLFKDYAGDEFFFGKLEKNSLPVNFQMESVVFTDNCTLYLTNEEKPDEPGKLFRIKLCE